MLTLNRVNRIAALAILPLMALAIVVGAKFANRDTTAAPPTTPSTLVVGELRGEALTFIDFGASVSTRALALPGPPHEFVSAGGRLYLTLGRANQLLEIDPNAPGILRSMDLGGEPNGLALQDPDTLLATLDKGNQVVAIDRASLWLSPPSRPTGNTPHNVAVSGSTMFVTDSRDNALSEIDVHDGTRLTAPTGALPESVTVAGNYIVTADADGGTITLLTRQPFATLGSIAVGGHPVRVITLDATHVLVALNGTAEVAVVDLATHHVQRRLTTLGHPDGLCLSPDSAYLAVVSNEANAVQLFRTSDWALSGTYPVPGGPGACIWLPPH